MNFFQKYPIPIVAVAFILLLLTVINLFRSDKPPQVVEEVFSSVYGNWISQAEQLAGVLDQGARVVVMDFERDLSGARGRGYKRVLGALEEGGLSIEHIERVVFSEAAGWDMNLSGFPYSEFMRVADEYAGVDAVISFCGPPYAIDHRQAPDPSALPKLLVVSGDVDAMTTERLYGQGWVYAASVPRGAGQFELLAETK